MTINDISTIRTGLVVARKKKNAESFQTNKYKLLNLKCISQEGNVDLELLDDYEVSEQLKEDYLTKMGDILVRLSAPYTSVIINKVNLCGIVVPSHFAIIRVNRKIAVPEYVFWSIRRNKSKMTLMQNSSGSTAFGTISSGLIGSLSITNLPISKQKITMKKSLTSL